MYDQRDDIVVIITTKGTVQQTRKQNRQIISCTEHDCQLMIVLSEYALQSDRTRPSYRAWAHARHGATHSGPPSDAMWS